MTASKQLSEILPLILVIEQYKEGEWGFTGTRAGMNDWQKQIVQRTVTAGQPSLFRHGGARGSDEEAHRITKKACHRFRANVWPADEKRAAVFRGDPHVTVEEPMDPLVRNVIIVDRSAFLLATPNKDEEIQRSGTWHTIRQAMSRNRPVLIIWPSFKMTLYRDRTLSRVSYGDHRLP